MTDNLPATVDPLTAEALEHAAEELEADAAVMHVGDDATFFAACAQLIDVAAYTRLIEGERKRVTKPQLDAKKIADAFFAEIAKPAKNAEEKLRAELGAWHVKRYNKAMAAQRRAIARAEKAADKAQGSGGDLAVVAPGAAGLELESTTKCPNGRVGFRLKTRVTVTDAGALPAEFLKTVPDLAKIEAAVDAGRVDLAGVLVTQEPVVTVTPNPKESK